MDPKANIQKIPFVDLKAQYASIEKEINQSISNVIQTTAFILGPDVTLFENEFAAYCGVKYAIGVDSGTSALELILRAYGIGQGDEVITVANTFIATVSSILIAGATPVLVDCDPVTLNISIPEIEKAITKKTKAIMPVHLTGQPVDMDAIMEIAQAHKLIVIEDACQASGAKYKGKRAGSIGHAGAFSFYPSKNLGCYGDGGIITTNDEKIVEPIRLLRNHGAFEKYTHLSLGYNHRLDTIQAAILRAKLPHLDDWNAKRREHAHQYNRLLAGTDIICPSELPDTEPIYHLYIARVKERAALMKYLSDNGISTGIHYPIPVHQQPLYKNLGLPKKDFPVTDQYTDQILSLPMYPELTQAMIDYVVDVIKKF
jgi:dTDP-4-amino-4,6-dideoxygalactose transaminase